jgi:ketosteroid isomerase-like protein
VFATGTGKMVYTNPGADPIVIPIFATSVRQLVGGKWVFVLMHTASPASSTSKLAASGKNFPAGFLLFGKSPKPANSSIVPTPLSSADQKANEELDSRFEQTFNKKDLDGVLACILNSPEYCHVSYGAVTRGRDTYAGEVGGLFKSFAGVKFEHTINPYWKIGDTVFAIGTGMITLTNPGADPVFVPMFATSARQMVDGKWVYLMIHLSAPPTPAPTAVSEETLPAGFSLLSSFPNPFNPATTIQYTIPAGRSEHFTLKVYDLRGALVKTLVDGSGHPGNYSVLWDGRDQTGNIVSSGMYLYRLQAGSFTESRKMLLLR